MLKYTNQLSLKLVQINCRLNARTVSNLFRSISTKWTNACISIYTL